MARIFRRAANKVINSRDGHGSLGLLIFDEKVVYESFQKLIIAKADGKFHLCRKALFTGYFLHWLTDLGINAWRVDLDRCRESFLCTKFQLKQASTSLEYFCYEFCNQKTCSLSRTVDSVSIRSFDQVAN